MIGRERSPSKKVGCKRVRDYLHMSEFGYSQVNLPDLLGVEKFVEVSNLLDFGEDESPAFVTLASNLKPPGSHSTVAFKQEAVFGSAFSCYDWRNFEDILVFDMGGHVYLVVFAAVVCSPSEYRTVSRRHNAW